MNKFVNIELSRKLSRNLTLHILIIFFSRIIAYISYRKYHGRKLSEKFSYMYKGTYNVISFVSHTFPSQKMIVLNPYYQYSYIFPIMPYKNVLPVNSYLLFILAVTFLVRCLICFSIRCLIYFYAIKLEAKNV